MPVEGPWVDRVNGLESVKVDIVMMRTLDGYGRLELTKFRNPKLVEIERRSHPNLKRLIQDLGLAVLIREHLRRSTFDKKDDGFARNKDDTGHTQLRTEAR